MQTTRDILLDHAEAEIRKRGFGAVSYGDLAELAGIRKASIHHHFPAKADLGLALVDRYGDRLAERLALHAARARNGAEALRAYMADCREAAGDGSTAGLLAALMADSGNLPPAMRQDLGRAHAMVAEWFGRTMQRGRQDRSISVSGEPSQEGLAALAQIQGAQLLARTARDPAAFDQATATLTARLFRS